MSSTNIIETLISDYEKKADQAITELQRNLRVAMQERQSMGEVNELGRIVNAYKRENKVTNSDLSLLAGISANTISKVTRNPAISKIETLLALLEPMGMTLNITRKA